MGCLKLSYYQTYSNQKVLYSNCVLEPKSAQMWLSVDPMSDKYPSMSPYNYCANNPVILVDPDGLYWIAYDVDNNIVGSGGTEDDKRKFVIFNQEDITNMKDRTDIDIDQVESAVQIPDNETINKVLNYCIESDNDNPYREYKGWVTDVNGKSNAVLCNPGPSESLCDVDFLNTGDWLDLADGFTPKDLYGFFAEFHLHPSGVFHCENEDRAVRQTPTPDSDGESLKKIQSLKSSYVFMMTDKVVYLINKQGVQGAITFDKFKNLGK
jgi:RHS repeat-associated protein